MCTHLVLLISCEIVRYTVFILINISMINCKENGVYIYRAAVTWTGSVTFGAGSEDPPPNKVEIVFPSSERQQTEVLAQLFNDEPIQ